MDCKKMTYMIQRYFEGELTQLERAHLEAHAGECDSCRAEMDAYRRVFSLLGDLDHEEVPANFDSTVIARVKALRQARIARVRAAGLRWVGVGSEPLTRLIRYPVMAVIALIAVCFPFIMLRGGLKEAATSFVVLVSDTIVTVSTAMGEFGVLYRLMETFKKDLRILETIINALGSLAWMTGETVMLPGALLLGGIILFALFYRSAHKRRPHHASFNF